MLIYNVDVSDLLSNGTMGTLIAVELTNDGCVDKLIIKFTNPKVGLQSRKKHPNYRVSQKKCGDVLHLISQLPE